MAERLKMFEVFFNPDHGDGPAYVCVDLATDWEAQGYTVHEALHAAYELQWIDRDAWKAAMREKIENEIRTLAERSARRTRR